MKDSSKTTKGVSRRTFLKTASAAAGLAAGSGAITGFPTIWAQNPITLRQFGTGVSNINAIAQKCKEDLGITLEMTATDSDAAAQRAVTQPNSYDIADIEYWILKKVYPTGVIQPMETSKLKFYDKVVPLFKTGKLLPDSVIAQGTAPHTVGYVEKPGTKKEGLINGRPASEVLQGLANKPGIARAGDRFQPQKSTPAESKEMNKALSKLPMKNPLLKK